MKDTSKLIKALEILAQDVESGDGVANAVIAEAATTILELVAQVEALRDAGNEVYAELQQWALTESHEETSRVFKLWLDTRASTPQQCLREIRADAGRAGFVRGIQLRQLGPCNDWDGAADQYAEEIRKGEVK